MKLFSIGLQEEFDIVQANLQNDCNKLKSQGFLIKIDVISGESYTFLECNVIQGEMSFRNYEKVKNIIKSYVAKHLFCYIIEYKTKALIKQHVMKKYQYLNEEEKQAVYKHSLRLIKENDCDQQWNEMKTDMQDKLLYYLEENQNIMVDGFINFRLPSYQIYLAEIMDKALDLYMMEIEYQEFIQVLRYFVKMNTEQALTIQVIMNGTGPYLLLDETGELLHYQYIDFVDRRTADDYAELLISTLINIAPQKIIVRNMNGDINHHSLIKTLKNIFQDRIYILSEDKMDNISIHLDSDLL